MEYETIVDGEEWEFPSKSNPSKRYTVKLNGNVRNIERSGMLSCNCPAWIFKRNTVRTCKHCEEIMNKELLVTDKIEMLTKRRMVYGEV